MLQIIETIKHTIDWFQEKLKTKFGFTLLGFILGFVFPLSYINYEFKYLEHIKSNYEKISEENKRLSEEVKYWQHKTFESESNYMNKIKELLTVFDSLESSYEKKYQIKQEQLEKSKTQLEQLYNIESRLKQIELKKENEYGNK